MIAGKNSTGGCGWRGEGGAGGKVGEVGVEEGCVAMYSVSWRV